LISLRYYERYIYYSRPVESAIRKKFTAKAKQLGFDSAQAYLRVIIKATVDGRQIDLDVDDWGVPSVQAATRLNKDTAEAYRCLQSR